MTITSNQIHSVLRTYSKQLKRGLRMNRIRQMESAGSVDTISISAEAKRKQVVRHVAAELLFRLAESGLPADEVDEKVLGTLAKEYGRPLRIALDKETGHFDFEVVDEKTGEVLGRPTVDEKESLNHRLTAITEEVVDETMFKG
jgi:hypothetical protein